MPYVAALVANRGDTPGKDFVDKVVVQSHALIEFFIKLPKQFGGHNSV
jgi:hypothetical protein